MILKELSIHNFRNYDSLHLSFSSGINILYGNNGQGKTNLLESIYVLGLTKSHRSFIDQHLIKKGEERAVIQGVINNQEIDTSLQLKIDPKTKTMKIDQDEIKKLDQYLARMNLIIFYPEDLSLIKGSPADRRRFLNLELSQLYSSYYTLLMEYQKLLAMRNDTLKQLAMTASPDFSYFTILTGYFVDKAIVLWRMRKKFLDKVNHLTEPVFQNISGLSNFSLQYKPSIPFVSWEQEDMKQTFLEKLKDSLNLELRTGSTSIGPHRDDFIFLLDEQNLRNYGSQGQQRMAILSVKLAEISLFKQCANTSPILLLDDVFSELDDEKKNNLLSYIGTDMQTIITTTDLKNVDPNLLSKAKLIKIDHGTIENIEEVE